MRTAWLAGRRRRARAAREEPADEETAELATAARSGISEAAGWAQSRLEPQVDQVVEVRLFDLISRVELATGH